MPGKQMAIDADLSAGLIDEQEAKVRRRQLEEESSFCGAMDGAAKFVRGGAIAGLLITFINLVGGLIIGVGQMGVSFAEAAHSYTLLTVGDGLVSQIPALVVSTAAGLLVAKAGGSPSAPTARCSASSAPTRARSPPPAACSPCSRSCPACRCCRSSCSRPRAAGLPGSSAGRRRLRAQRRIRPPR